VKHCIIVGCDVHVKEMLLKLGADREEPHQRTFRNTHRGRQQMLGMLKGLSEESGGARVVFAYESSSLGYVLYDEVTAAGFECYVLATSKLARTWKHLAYKTDARDAHLLFQQARNFVLAGDPLPLVVVPEPQVRDDREVTRARSDAAGKLTRVKNQVQGLLKRYGLERPDDTGASWSKAFRAWLEGLLARGPLGWGARVNLCSLLRQLQSLEEEIAYLDEQMAMLAQQPRYAAGMEAMSGFKGVGVTVALTMLTELGDLERFPNRRRLASYLGLVPTSHESGEATNRKGHITHQGPPRLRRVLCQAVQGWVRWSPWAKARYHRLVARGGRRAKKIAKVALMRLLGIRLWRVARDAQATGCQSACD
jgi:transposase